MNKEKLETVIINGVEMVKTFSKKRKGKPCKPYPLYISLDDYMSKYKK